MFILNMTYDRREISVRRVRDSFNVKKLRGLKQSMRFRNAFRRIHISAVFAAVICNDKFLKPFWFTVIIGGLYD